jgi:hypothetical protein
MGNTDTEVGITEPVGSSDTRYPVWVWFQVSDEPVGRVFPILTPLRRTDSSNYRYYIKK